MEVGHGGAAAATSTLSIPGILHAAGESRDDLIALRSLASAAENASEAAQVLLQATCRLQRCVDVVCNLMRQLRASRKRTSQSILPKGAIADSNRMRLLQHDPALLAALERHMRTCVADLKRVIHGFRYSLSVYNQSKGPKKALPDRQAALEESLKELAQRIIVREQALAQHLVMLGCHFDYSVSPSSTSSGNSADGGSGNVANNEPKAKPGPSTSRLENSVVLGGINSRNNDSAVTPGHSPTTVGALLQRSGSSSLRTKSGIEITVNGSASPLSDSASADSTVTINMSGHKRNVFSNKKNSASLSRRLAELTLSRSGDSAETQINNRQQHHEYYYSCDALGGVDDGADELEDGSLSCRFCGIRFVHDDEMTAYRLSAHLVRAHSFGLCNLNCTFSTREALMEHLYSFHRWSRMSQSPEVINHWFRRRKELGVPLARGWRLLSLEDGDAQPLRGLREEREEMGLLQLQVLNSILQAADLNICMHPDKADWPAPPPTEGSVAFDPGQVPMAHKLCQALTSLDKLAVAEPGTSKSAAASPSSKGVNGCSAKRKNTVGLEDLMYHAACVQQEMAITSGVGDADILRHEALYTAEQYKLDDLVCMYFPPRASPATERHRLWHVRAATSEGGDRKAKLRAQKLRKIQGLGIERIESNRPLRSFRDAVRVLGRAHMDQSGATGYIGVMPQVLEAAGVLLWQEGRSSEAVRPGTYVPLNAENLRVFTELQERSGHPLANTPSQRRFHWVSSERLDWWFLGMMERSASFRRLIKSGKAFPPPTPTVSKSRKSASVKESPAATETPKARLMPYGWAVNLLCSAGLPQGKATVNVARSVGGEPRSFGRANGITNAGYRPSPQQMPTAAALVVQQQQQHHYHQHQQQQQRQEQEQQHHHQQQQRQLNGTGNYTSQERAIKRPHTPDVSMVGADYGTCSSSMSVEESGSPQYRQNSPQFQEQVGESKSKPDLIQKETGKKFVDIAVDSDSNDDEDEDDDEDAEDDDDEDDDENEEDYTEYDEDAITSDSASTSSESSS